MPPIGILLRLWAWRMPGPAGQELRDRRRRTATLLSKYIKESAQAWDGATSANRLERSAAQTVHATPEAPSVPVVQAESIPNREPGCCEQLLEYIGWRSEAGATKLNRISVNGNLDITVR